MLALTPTAPFGSTNVAISFDGANSEAAPIQPGLNTLRLSASGTPVPDIIALAVSVSVCPP